MSFPATTTCLACAAWLLTASCAAPPPPPAPAPPPPPVVAPPPPPPAPVEEKVDPPVQDCGQDPAQESPIVEGALGEGERTVRLLNNSQSMIQARLLDADLQPAVRGTLHIPPGSTGTFHVAEGKYVVRYRYGSNCHVRRGKPLDLRGPRAGVEISIKPVFDDGTKANMQRVEEPL